MTLRRIAKSKLRISIETPAGALFQRREVCSPVQQERQGDPPRQGGPTDGLTSGSGVFVEPGQYLDAGGWIAKVLENPMVKCFKSRCDQAPATNKQPVRPADGFLFGKVDTDLKLTGTRKTGPSKTPRGKNNQRRNPKSNNKNPNFGGFFRYATLLKHDRQQSEALELVQKFESEQFLSVRRKSISCCLPGARLHPSKYDHVSRF
ncbi:hypothetical protein [Roseibium sp.]|uniref:hypothetical protein n=1 Tax=Roseibium sp. TaxID=1936156 RepID=UPI003D132DB3